MTAEEAQEELTRIGAQLRLARVKAYLTQSDVGHLAGVSRQLVSRIEQGCNGEISAYFSVAAALNHRFTLEEGPATNETDMAALDFGARPTGTDDSVRPAPGSRKPTGRRATGGSA